MKHNRYIFACLFFFVGGAYLWKIKADGLTTLVHPLDGAHINTSDPAKTENKVLFEIGKEIITNEDIDWEFQLIIQELRPNSKTKNGPLVSNFSTAEALALKKKLASGLIERKVLYSAIQRDESFDLTDPNRYLSCLTEWKELVDREQIQESKDRARLKNRLCERSVLEQYMAERLFRTLSVEAKDVAQYYEANRSQFRQFESVTIKHILFVDEPTAKRWRSVLTVQNFSNMARIHSITPEGKSGGRLGPFAKGMLPAVFDLAFHMKIGEISDILRSNYGYHVILLEEKNQRRSLDLASARPEVEKILLKKKRESIYDAWLEQALASVRVTAPKANM
jgi:hypothetical protein